MKHKNWHVNYSQFTEEHLKNRSWQVHSGWLRFLFRLLDNPIVYFLKHCFKKKSYLIKASWGKTHLSRMLAIVQKKGGKKLLKDCTEAPLAAAEMMQQMRMLHCGSRCWRPLTSDTIATSCSFFTSISWKLEKKFTWKRKTFSSNKQCLFWNRFSHSETGTVEGVWQLT